MDAGRGREGQAGQSRAGEGANVRQEVGLRLGCRGVHVRGPVGESVCTGAALDCTARTKQSRRTDRYRQAQIRYSTCTLM